MKIITFYLPQFHEIPENNKWWGKGFTEWVNVKKAKPLFNGHYQPRIPENKNYYNLLNKTTIEWQANIAKKYGIYGFCFYHYWFDGHMLLEKPMEIFLNDKNININFCISWANEDWTNAWTDGDNKTLISQNYGFKQDWIKHFNYFLKFFKDNRYIKINNKPLLIIYRPELIGCLNEMLDTWNELAIKEGFDGIEFAYQHYNFSTIKNKDDSRFSYQIEYQPQYCMKEIENRKLIIVLKKLKNKADIFFQKIFHKKIEISSIFKGNLKKYDYDELWNNILKRNPENKKNVPGAFVGWDNTPRKGTRGSVVINNTPDKFESYMIKQINNAKEKYKKDMIFMFAWNEWAEGGYLEPDEKYKFKYLQAIKNSLEKTNENPYLKG